MPRLVTAATPGTPAERTLSIASSTGAPTGRTSTPHELAVPVPARSRVPARSSRVVPVSRRPTRRHRARSPARSRGRPSPRGTRGTPTARSPGRRRTTAPSDIPHTRHGPTSPARRVARTHRAAVGGGDARRRGYATACPTAAQDCACRRGNHGTSHRNVAHLRAGERSTRASAPRVITLGRSRARPCCNGGSSHLRSTDLPCQHRVGGHR